MFVFFSASRADDLRLGCGGSLTQTPPLESPKLHTLGTAPHTVRVYNSATIKGLIYPYYEYYSTVTEWGRYPIHTVQHRLTKPRPAVVCRHYKISIWSPLTKEGCSFPWYGDMANQKQNPVKHKKALNTNTPTYPIKNRRSKNLFLVMLQSPPPLVLKPLTAPVRF